MIAARHVEWGRAMAAQVLEIRIGDVDVLVETVPIAGSQQTSGRVGKVAKQTADAFAHAQDAILSVATSTAEMIAKTAARAAKPDRVEIEFGLRFSASGQVILGGVTGEGTLRVLLSYESKEKGGPAESRPLGPGT
jgi:Trypsin-co-occurring domain 1